LNLPVLTMEQKESIRSGLIAEIGAVDFAVWMTIQAHMDFEGVSFPSQRRIAELIGTSTPTVNKAVQRLIDLGAIDRELVGDKRKKTIYSTPEGTTHFTASTFIKRFCQLYQQTFGVNYTPNWSRDGAMVKNKLIGQFTDEELEAMLTITFRDFTKRWQTRHFPRPSIGSVTTFIGNQALAIWQEEQKKEQVITEAQEQDLSKFFNQTF